LTQEARATLSLSLELELVPQNRNCARRSFGSGIGAEQSKLKGAIGRAANHIDNIFQRQTASIDEGAVALGKRDDTVAGMNLSAQFGGSSGKQLINNGVSILDAEGRANADGRHSANGGDGSIAFGGILNLIGGAEGSICVGGAPTGKDGVEEFSLLFRRKLIAQREGGSGIGTNEVQSSPAQNRGTSFAFG